MANKASTVTIKILADAKKAIADMGRLGSEADRSDSRFGKLTSTTKLMAGAALAFVGTKVADFLRDAAMAAAEDEKSQRLLALAMENSAGATVEQVEATEGWIDAMARSTGVADDQLRPALAELVRATGDTELAQDQLQVAMDISAAKGLDLQAVTVAMSKAQLGNVGALGRLGIATRDTEGKMLTFEEVLDNASRTMGGAAFEAAQTLEGQMKRLQVAWEEQKETLGQTLIPVLSTAASTLSFFVSGFTGETEHAIDAMNTRLGELVKQGIDPMQDRLRSATSVLVDANRKTVTTVDSVRALKDMFELSAPEIQTMSQYLKENQDALGLSDSELREMTVSLDVNAQALEDQGRGLGINRGQVEDAEQAYDELTAAMQAQADELRAQTDPLFAVFKGQQDVTEAKKAYTEALLEGGPGSDKAIEAAWELTRAEQSLDGALIAVRDSGMTKDEFLTWQTGMGRSAQEAENLADDLERVEGFDWPDPEVTLRVNVPTIEYAESGNGRKLTPTVGKRLTLGSGGIATGPVDALIGEARDDEAIIPLNREGIKVIADAMKEAGMNSGPGGSAYITINAGLGTDPRTLERAVVEALQSWQRSNGAIPITVRSA